MDNPRIVDLLRAMPRLAANLSFLFTEWAFLDRFAAAARAGFEAVEFFSPYEYPHEVIVSRLRAAGLAMVLFNIRMGTPETGERGLAAVPGCEAAFERLVEEALVLAGALGCSRIHVLAGTVPIGVSRDACHATFAGNLRRAAPAAAARSVELLIEPLNAIDNPGYALRTTNEAMAILDAVGSANVRLQLDLYHLQISEGDLARRIERLAPYVGHVQIAGNPGRHEPSDGEVNFPYLLELLDRIGYAGFVGCEYRPRHGTVAGLGWAERYGIAAS